MKIKIKLPAFITAVLIFTSCTKSFLDVNTNPNAVVDVTPKTLLPNTTVGMAFTNGNELGKAAGLLMQYNAGILGQSAAYDTWNIGSLDNSWSNEVYTDVINNLGTVSYTHLRAHET